MLFIKSFANYNEFKEVFAVVEHGNGVKSRKNKILLGWLKDRKFLHWWLQFREQFKCKEAVDSTSYLFSKNMNDAEKAVKFVLNDAVRIQDKGYSLHKMAFSGINWFFYSRDFKFDYAEGLCEDGDTRAVRYINTARDERVFKMKAGKFITTSMEELYPTKLLPEQVKRWVGEEFARAWQAYAEDKIGQVADLTLHVGSDISDFRDIYDSSQYAGNFHSCMADNDQYEFYANAVDASAAYLRNADGYIVARCIIFNSVTDEYGDTWRLAERQYSTDCNDVLKQILVNRLISEKLIDGYKKVGVDCHDNRNYVANDGTSLKDKKFSIRCNLEDGDTLSYQDSFVYYNIYENVAYNYNNGDYTDELNATEIVFEENHCGQTYSELEDEWLDDDVAVYDEINESYIHQDHAVDCLYHGRRYSVYKSRMDDFVWSEYEAEYIHIDDVVELYDGDYCLSENAVCDINGDYRLVDDCEHSDYLGEWIDKDEAVFSDNLDDYLYRPEAFYSSICDDWFDEEDEKTEAEIEFTKEHTLMCVNA